MTDEQRAELLALAERDEMVRIAATKLLYWVQGTAARQANSTNAAADDLAAALRARAAS